MATTGRKEAARHFQTVLREGKATRELMFRPKSGEPRWWLVSAVKISDNRFLGFCNDITDRKRAEERLRASEEQFRDISTNIPGVIYQLQTGRTGALEVTYMSAAAEALFEHSLAGLDFSALLFDRMHAGDRALFQHSLAKAAKNMERWNLEFRIHPAPDRIKWLRGSANPRKPPNGGVIWSGVLLDITELKLAEQSLRERETFQNLLMDTIPSPVFYKDRQGRYLGFNKAFEAFYGKPKDQLIGKSVFDIAPPDLAKIYHEKDAILFEEPGTQIYEAPMQDANGTPHDVVFHKASIVDAQGTVTGLVGILLDITERKRTEAKILHESALNAAIIESIPGTFYMLDETGAYMRWSRYQREAIVGKTEEQMAGTSALATIHPDDRALVQARIGNVLKHGTEEVVEGRVLLRGGPEFRWLLMTGRRMFVQDRPALIGIGIDITERKWAEEQVAQQLDELRRWQAVTLGREGRVAELKREVNAFAARLGQPPPYPSAETP
jgi:PAS domain S-box-containing protein